MITVEKEYISEAGRVLCIRIHTACCKDYYEVLELGPNDFLSLKSLEPLSTKQANQVRIALGWKKKQEKLSQKPSNNDR